MGEVLIESGYSKSISTTPTAITKSKGWQELLNEIDDDELLKKVRAIALDSDKRASLQAIDMIMKLKDKYPAGKIKLGALDQRNQLTE